ncbi:DAAM2 (predicted) [Pycnogonum litorale]
MALHKLSPVPLGLRRASKEVKQSRKLKKLLEIVLAIGNYMNRGQRGNAYGFKLSSLNRLVDTKSSTNRSMTLLHHIINIISIKFKDLLRLGDEISSVRMACKVNMTELTNEINSLKRGMQEIKKELEYNHAHPNTTVKTDQFVPVVEEFVVSASFECSGLVDLYNDMKTKYDEVTVMYAEDSNQVNTEEFFGGLNTFLNSFAEAISENETFRKSTEEQMKIKIESEKNNETSKETNRVFSKMEVRKATINGRNEKTNGEFDDLISALRTGDVFGDDLAKIRKVGRRRSSQPVNNVRNPPSPSPVRTDSVKSESTRERIARKY